MLRLLIRLLRLNGDNVATTIVFADKPFWKGHQRLTLPAIYHLRMGKAMVDHSFSV